MIYRRQDVSLGLLTIAALCVTGAVSAQELPGARPAQPQDDSTPAKSRHVDYGFTTNNNCVRATPHPPSIVGIDPNTRALLVPGQAITQSGGGVMHFFANGQLTVDATAAEVNLSENQPGNLPQTTGLVGTCSGSWSSSLGNRVAVHFSCHVNITTQGVSFDLGPTNADGFVSNDGSAINLNQGDDLQTVNLLLPNGTKLTSERTCVQRFALTRITPRSRDDDDADSAASQ